MSPPILKSNSAITVSFASTLTLPAAGASPGDLIIARLHGVAWFGGNVGGPSIPSGFHVLQEFSDGSGFDLLVWGKVPKTGMSQIVFTAGPDQLLSGGWWGSASVYSNVAYRSPGWVDIPGTSGDYVTFTRADYGGAITYVSVFMRVSFNQLGVAQWFYGWANGDLGFGLDANNRPIAYVNNTLGNPIGNVAANAAIPGLAVGRPVWLRFTITVATGNIDYAYTFADLPEFGSATNHQTILGTAVAGTNAGTTVRLTNSDTVFVGARDAVTAPFNGNVYAAYEYLPYLITVAQVFSDALAAGWALVGGDVIHYRPTGEDFENAPFDDWAHCSAFCYPDPDNVTIPAREVYGVDRLVHHTFMGDALGGHTNDPIVGPADWDAQADRAANALGLYLKNISRTRTADANTPSAPVSASTGYHYNYSAYVIKGRSDSPILPVFPQPPRIELGCAETYNAYITDMTYNTVIDEIRWSSLDWERVLDDISSARVVAPDELGGVQCIAKHGGLKAWKHGLRIERNDELVWRGPVTNVQRSGDSVTVQANDTLARYRRRFAIRTGIKDYVQADCGLVFREVLADLAHLDSDQWEFLIPEFTTGVPIDRVLKTKEFKYAWDFISELLSSAVDAFVANGQLFVYEAGTGWVYQLPGLRRTLPGSYNINHDLTFGMFTEESWSDRPDWSLDGFGQGNYFVVPVADSGEYGFRTFAVAEVAAAQLEFGVLDYVDPDPLEVPADQSQAAVAASLRSRSNTLAALRGYAPSSIEGGVLSASAPVNVDNLLPGSIWLMDVYDAGYGQLLTASRVRRIKVDVSRSSEGGIVEKVQPVLEPPGWQGALES